MTSPDPAAAARARHGRVQAAMAGRGVGALLLATPHLAAFASGARRVQVAGSGGAVPWVVIVAGAPAVVFTTDPDGAVPGSVVEPLCWDRARQWTRLRAAIAGTRGALACDVFSPALRRLADDLGRSLLDAAPVLAAACGPKTADEVALVERALAAARAGVRAATSAPTVGEARARAAETMSAAGAGFPLAELLAWRSGRRLGGEGSLVPGDALEFAVQVGGHAGVAGDTTGVDDARRRAWATALCAVAKACRAGTTAGEIRAAGRDAGAAGVGPLVRGLGVGIEPPVVDLERDDDAVLAAGTVLVLAPTVGSMRATRALLVTEGAPRWLEPAP